MWGRLTRLFDLNTVAGITDQTSQQPKQHADREDNSFLCSAEISAKNVDERYHATHYPHIEPPENPVVNPYVDVHKPSSHLS
jgi:hypothetical protein